MNVELIICGLCFVVYGSKYVNRTVLTLQNYEPLKRLVLLPVIHCLISNGNDKS